MCGRKKPQARKNGLSLFASSSLIDLVGDHAVGLLVVGAVGREPAERAAEPGRALARRVQREDESFSSSSLSRPRGLTTCLPRRLVVEAVGADLAGTP